MEHRFVRDIPTTLKELTGHTAEFFTGDAQQVLKLAHDTSQEYGVTSIDDLHMLAGLVKTMPIYTDSGERVSPTRLMSAIMFCSPMGQQHDYPERTFNATAVRIIEIAANEANKLGLKQIDARCLMLGILEEPGAIAASFNVKMGALGRNDQMNTFEDRLRKMQIDYA